MLGRRIIYNTWLNIEIHIAACDDCNMMIQMQIGDLTPALLQHEEKCFGQIGQFVQEVEIAEHRRASAHLQTKQIIIRSGHLTDRTVAQNGIGHYLVDIVGDNPIFHIDWITVFHYGWSDVFDRYPVNSKNEHRRPW